MEETVPHSLRDDFNDLTQPPMRKHASWGMGVSFLLGGVPVVGGVLGAWAGMHPADAFRVGLAAMVGGVAATAITVGKNIWRDEAVAQQLGSVRRAQLFGTASCLMFLQTVLGFGVTLTGAIKISELIVARQKAQQAAAEATKQGPLLSEPAVAR